MRFVSKTLFTILILFSFFYFSASSASISRPLVRVVVINSDENQGVTQDSIALWKMVAENLDFNDHIVATVSSASAAYKMLQNNQADVAVGALLYDTHQKNVFVINNYLQHTLFLIIPADVGSFWGKISPYFKTFFNAAIGTVGFFLLIVGFLVWLAERKQNSGEFSRRFFPGWGSGIWFSIATMTTVGYGDKVPRSLLGRFIGGSWAVIMMLAVSSLTGVVAAELTNARTSTNEITSANQLINMNIGYLSKNKNTGEFIESIPAHPVPVKDLRDMIASVDAGQIPAAFVSRLDLQFYREQNPNQFIKLAPFKVRRGSYIFATRSTFSRNAAIAQELYILKTEDKITALETP